MNPNATIAIPQALIVALQGGAAQPHDSNAGAHLDAMLILIEACEVTRYLS